MYLARVAAVWATSSLAAACCDAVGFPDETGAITMPLAMVVAPLTLPQTVFDVAGAAAAGAAAVGADEAAPERPIAMPVIAFVPDSVSVEGAGAVLGAGSDDASDTVVAASTATAARPTVPSPVHHSRAGRPRHAQRSFICCPKRCMPTSYVLSAPTLSSVPASFPDVTVPQCGCEGRVTRSPRAPWLNWT